MANIYQIEEELLGIFDTIEENEGELTPELEEVLSIKQDEFKDKIQAYAAVVKQLELDLTGIKAEKCRLADLQKSKEKTIDRIKNVMAEAINLFGNTSKSGSKFIDFGTGKISLRHSDSIEVDDAGTKQFVNRFFGYFGWLKYTNTLNQERLDYNDIISYCNNASNDVEDSVNTEYTKEDFENLKADLDLRVNLKDIVSTPEGRSLITAMLNYTTTISSKPVVDKTAIKKEFKETGSIPTFSNYVSKDNVIIK